jgi:hypothetical protein
LIGIERAEAYATTGKFNPDSCLGPREPTVPHLTGIPYHVSREQLNRLA